MISTRHVDYEMFDLFEMTPDLVCIASKDGYLKKVNPAVVVKLGYSEEELFSRPISSFIHPDDKELTGKERNKLLQGKTLLNFQNRYIKKNGDFVWLEWTSVYLPAREIVFAIAKDITESKKRQKEVEAMHDRYKNMASHFKNHIEKDRKYLAHELHEELAQMASLVKMNMAWVKDHDGLSEEGKEKAANALFLSDLLLKKLRKVSFSISPSMLDDFGFIATLEWECKEFSSLNKIPCNFSTNCEDEDFTKEIAIDLFRICQEALTNVMEHAEAKHVSINLIQRENILSLSIADDGKGFDINKLEYSAGLQHIWQRTVSINGHLMIQSHPGKGTTITVEVKK